jgi:Ca2+-binding RTX toxin-like protein
MTLDISESNANGGIRTHVMGSVIKTPPDTDGDGVFDNADNCPRIANSSQQMIAPLIAPSGPVQASTCGSVPLGQPSVQDRGGAGGIVTSNDAPSRFLLGDTTVTWTVRDGRGNFATATQVVTVQMGDDPACCPAGSHIIMGTTGNDILTGTAGPDCIIGLGGQDLLSGPGATT